MNQIWAVFITVCLSVNARQVWRNASAVANGAGLHELYRCALERTRSKVQGKLERAPELMRQTPSHRRVEAKA
ncbi:hypothetical protein [Methylobacterium platani]|uniref:hypothetical protein n=1 Tax=Methylobacterium platani TaxID=427683 RepID=UPI000A58C766|nr:hypothetical protein [Methylobacterium platani]